MMIGRHGLQHRGGSEPVAVVSPTAKGFPLMMADEGARVCILALQGGKGLTTRLTELGLNVGTELHIVQRQGGGLLVARGESRIALGAGMAAKIQVAPLA
jgi:ferrous iron transport protein A